MKSYQPACLLLMIICSTCSYGQLWKQYNDSAKNFLDQKKTDKAIEWYSKAVEELKKDSAGTKTYVYYCDTLALHYTDLGQFDKAESLFLESKQIREKLLGNQHPEYITSCNNLAFLYVTMSQYDKAEPLHLEVKQICEKVLGKQHPNYASACNNLAILYKEMGLYEKAKPLYLEAKQIREKILGKQHPNYAASCNNLASFYMAMGQYEEAEPLYLEAKQIREQLLGKQQPNYAALCNNLAVLYMTMGQYEKAEPLYLEAKQIREKVFGKQHPDYAASCNNLAFLYLTMGQHEKVEPLFLEAKQVYEMVLGKQHPDYAGTCNNLAILYEEMGQYKKAEPLYLEAKQIREKMLGKQHPDYAASCRNLAFLCIVTGQYKKAEQLYLEAKQIHENLLGKQHPYYGKSCEDLANLYRLMHQPLKAEKEFAFSFSVMTHNLSSVFQFTNEKEKVAYIKNISGEDDIAYSFYLSEKIQSGQPYSLSLFHRNLILSSSQALRKQLSSSEDSTLIKKYHEWTSIKKRLSILYSKPVDERKEDAAELEEKADKQEKALTRLSAAFAKGQQRVDWKDIQQKLKADEASIEFASFHVHNGKRRTDTVFYVAIVLRKNMPLPVTVFLCNEKQLSGLLSTAATKIPRKGIQKLYKIAGTAVNKKPSNAISLYDLVWKPLEKELNGIKTIYFAPAGTLHRIAFAALPVNNKEVLSDRYKLIQLATTASVADQQHTYITPSDKIQLYGGISYDADTAALKDLALSYHVEKVAYRSLPDDLIKDGGWDKLPGTKNEIAGIVSLSNKHQSNITALSGLNATEESLKALDGTASPAVLHIATHGFFFPDPKQNGNQRNYELGTAFKLSDDPLMRSGLLFAGANNAWQNKPAEGIDDGILTSYEVSNLYLPNTKLVVLSACETALGEIHGSEGIYGLQRAFKIAGVPNVVMSLWKVSDLEAVEFMETFYKHMFARQSISDAFYNTQKVMKNKYRLNPYKWAAWVLVR